MELIIIYSSSDFMTTTSPSTVCGGGQTQTQTSGHCKNWSKLRGNFEKGYYLSSTSSLFHFQRFLLSIEIFFAFLSPSFVFCEGEVTICQKPAPKQAIFIIYVQIWCRGHSWNILRCSPLHWLQSEVDCIINTLSVPIALCECTFELLFYLILWPLNNLIFTQDRTGQSYQV